MPRPLCHGCRLPAARCYCAHQLALDNAIPLLLLQHPAEAGHSKNTAAFLQACLRHCHTWQVETLEPARVRQLAQLHNPCLLYPEHPALPTAPPVTEAPGCLLVLDATWRKSLKMLYLNPVLATLPRIALSAPVAGRYRIRTRARTNQLSTFEASCYALAQLERAPERYQPALAAFDRYMAQLATLAPAAHRLPTTAGTPAQQ